MVEKFHYTNDMMASDLQNTLAQMHSHSYVPDLILGIQRGGLVPAVMLSHHFNVPMTTGVLALRDHRIEDLESFHTTISALNNKKKVLLVDEICDGGHTLNRIYNCLSMRTLVDEKTYAENFRFLVCVNNAAQTLFTPDYVGRSINKAHEDVWVVFPWENWQSN